MLDHVSVQVADVAAACEFYLSTLGPLGIREAMRYERNDGAVVGLCGPDGFPRYWLGPSDLDGNNVEAVYHRFRSSRS